MKREPLALCRVWLGLMPDVHMLLQVWFDGEPGAVKVPEGSAQDWVQPEASQLAARARAGSGPSAALTCTALGQCFSAENSCGTLRARTALRVSAWLLLTEVGAGGTWREATCTEQIVAAIGSYIR
jgi:hypothetical protein